MKKLSFASLVAIAASSLAATGAEAAVSINITQVGANIALTATGTFDRTLATTISNGTNFGQYLVAGVAFAGFGVQAPDTAYVASGPATFGSSNDADTAVTSDAGTGIGIYGAYPSFFIAQSYVNNAAIMSSGLVANTTLAGLGLVAGVYNYTVGGNAVTVNIGTAASAVPEPASWAMMILGMGAVGYALRRKVCASEAKFNAKSKRMVLSV